MATYALIHGAGDSSWCWHLVAPELRERGHDVVAVDLPCDVGTAGLNDYADAVVDSVAGGEDIVVVGHSLGGFTAPLVCERVDARLLVYVAGMVPAPGEAADDYGANAGYSFDESRDDADEWADDGVSLFYQDVSPELVIEAKRHWRDQGAAAMAEPWPLDALPHVPAAYLLCRDDRIFPADPTRQMVRERLGIDADEIDGGHCPFLSRPRELAERLDAYRAQLGG